jgi:hypothetical protein
VVPAERYRIGAVVNYCTNEYPFLRACLGQLSAFCSRVVVPVCDRFFDGTPEDAPLLERSEKESAGLAGFLHWTWDPDEQTGDAGRMYWEGKARWLGIQALDGCDFVLLLDVDEVVDGRRFVEWLEGFRTTAELPGGRREITWRDVDAFRFLSYWYFRDAAYRARTREWAGLLVRRSRLARETVISPHARNSLFAMTPGLRADAVRGLDTAPLVHHYSWVRTRDQMLKKVRSWGHARDRNWEALVEEEFSRPFNGTDFVHGYKFTSVEPFVHIDLSRR